MRFLIYRTSSYYVFEDLERLNIDLNKYKVYLEPHIDTLKIERKCTIIDIESLEELMELIKDYGDIVIQKPDLVEGIPELEIYDEYRE